MPRKNRPSERPRNQGNGLETSDKYGEERDVFDAYFVTVGFFFSPSFHPRFRFPEWFRALAALA